MEQPSSHPPNPPEPPSASAALAASRWRRILRAVVVAYAAVIVATWVIMYWDGDRGVLATLILFGPRWLCALPLPFLFLAACVWDRRMAWLLAATALMIVFPIMGLEVHWPASSSTRVDLRVLTCNVDENNFQPALLAALIEEERIDLVALQEVSSATRFTWPPDWHVVARDEFILASRFPISERARLNRVTQLHVLAATCYTLTLPDRELLVFNLHLESPRQGLEAVLSAKRGIEFAEIPRLTAVLQLRAIESEKVSAWVESFPEDKIVMGDFNTPAESTIFRRDWSGLSDAFAAAGCGFGFTKVTEKQGWSYGTRIDHVLFSSRLRCVRSWVARDIGSDHLPLAAEFAIGQPD